MANPIVTALADMMVGLETSFERLSIVPLIGRNREPGVGCITLDEALATGAFEVSEVSEAGEVPRLQVTNRGAKPVLLLDGEELVGAKQNRIVNLTILVPPKTNLQIPVTCVEAGRWHQRGRGFTSSGNAQYSRARGRKMEQVSRSLASSGEARADQAWIWDDITAKSDRLAVDSGTSEMSAIFRAHQTSVDAYVNALPAVAGQRGAVFLHDGLPVGIDLFDSEAVFVALLPKLLRSHALDALDPGDVNAPRQLGLADFRDQAKSFLGTIAHAAQAGAKLFPTVGLGQAMRVENGRLAAAALVLEQHVVHVAAFNLDG